MPCCKEHPTYKVAPFLRHVQEVSMLAWHLGHDISGNEQTIGFQGKHSDTLRRQRVMASNVMLYAKVVSHGHFISTINWHQRNTYNKAMLHCTHAFLECLTSWMRNITTVGLTICTCLPSSAGLPLLTQM